MAIEEITVPTRSKLWDPADAKAAYDLLSQGKSAKYGTYTGENAEGRARTQGGALSRLVGANHGRRFGVAVWKDQNGAYVGALVPRDPHKRTVKPKAGKASK